MTAENIMSWVMIIMVVCVFVKILHNTPKEEQEQGRYNYELSARIERINQLNRQIQSIQELLTDIDTAGSGMMKNFTIAWETVAGEEMSVDMLIGEQTELTERMRELAGERLNELTTSLFDELEKLPYRHRQNVDQTLYIYGYDKKGECR